MAGNYIKSLMWLVGCSSVGYGLYLICMASESQAVATNVSALTFTKKKICHCHSTSFIISEITSCSKIQFR